tara:strand:+ start:245 stop:397 length:153 start_codon:yes stop_codon:yes gene_type:complete
MSEETFQKVAYDAIQIMALIGNSKDDSGLKDYASLLQQRYEKILTEGALE